MRNTVFFSRSSMSFIYRSILTFSILLLFIPSLLMACTNKEPVDEDDVDPAINPPITFVEDDEETTADKEGPAFPDFGFDKDPLAFPGAEGHGRYAEGARAGTGREVYVVNNLNNSGPGSFKDAISQSNRVIVFGIAGVINLNKESLALKSNQTILFQTAPGDGIELFNGRTTSSGASNLIVRYMRVRPGRQVDGGDETDAGGCSNGKDQIYDHCSFTWGTDECFSLNRDGKGVGLFNITIQNSILGQGCMNHSCGGLIQTNDNEGITIFRNLLIDNKTRNFKIKGLNQYVNNIVYNWGNGAAYNMGGESAGHSNTVIENNYFIKGPAWTWQNYAVEDVDPSILADETICSPSLVGTAGKYYEVLSQVNPTKPFIGGNGDGDFDTYCVGNYYDDNKDGILNGVELTQANWNTYCSATPVFLSKPDAKHPAIKSQTSATEAYTYMVEKIGAYLPARDKVDAYMVEELTSLGKKGTIIRDQRKEQQYPLANTWQNIKIAAPLPDTDNDGIPDEFEDKWGLNKNNPNDAVRVANNGYTMIENYALSLEFPELFEKAWKETNNK